MRFVRLAAAASRPSGHGSASARHLPAFAAHTTVLTAHQAAANVAEANPASLRPADKGPAALLGAVVETALCAPCGALPKMSARRSPNEVDEWPSTARRSSTGA